MNILAMQESNFLKRTQDWIFYQTFGSVKLCSKWNLKEKS